MLIIVWTCWKPFLLTFLFCMQYYACCCTDVWFNGHSGEGLLWSTVFGQEVWLQHLDQQSAAGEEPAEDQASVLAEVHREILHRPRAAVATFNNVSLASMDGSIFSLGNWRALHHHAAYWLVSIHITWHFCPPVSMVKDATEPVYTTERQ